MQRIVCAARWASYAGGRAPGEPCGDQATEKLADAWFCDHHYSRVLDAAMATLQREREYEYSPFDWQPDAAEVVYYVQRLSDGLIKIGTSTRFRSRLSELRADYGPVRLLLTQRGDRSYEHAIHTRFAAFRVDGRELFQPGKPLLAWIVEVRQRQGPHDLLPATLPMADLLLLMRRRRPISKSKIDSATATETATTDESS